MISRFTHHRLLTSDDMVGRKVAAIMESDDYDGGCLWIRFEDGTFAYLCARIDRCDDGALISFRENPSSEKEALAVGVIDQTEYDRATKERNRWAMMRRRAEFERLKKEFEDQP